MEILVILGLIYNKSGLQKKEDYINAERSPVMMEILTSLREIKRRLNKDDVNVEKKKKKKTNGSTKTRTRHICGN